MYLEAIGTHLRRPTYHEPHPTDAPPPCPVNPHRPTSAVTRVSRSVSLLNVSGLAEAGGHGSPVKSPTKAPAGNKAFASAARRGAAELNSAHAEGSVLVVAFAPYAHDDNWRKTWLSHCLGLGRCAPRCAAAPSPRRRSQKRAPPEALTACPRSISRRFDVPASLSSAVAPPWRARTTPRTLNGSWGPQRSNALELALLTGALLASLCMFRLHPRQRTAWATAALLTLNV